jgi:hypothetical protein
MNFTSQNIQKNGNNYSNEGGTFCEENTVDPVEKKERKHTCINAMIEALLRCETQGKVTDLCYG